MAKIELHPVYLTDISKDDVVRALRADHQHHLADIIEQQWRDQVAKAAMAAEAELTHRIEAHNRLVEAGVIWNPLDPFGDKKRLFIEVPK